MKHNQKHFYTHLIEYQSIIIELDQMDLSDEEKLQLTQLIDSSIHHAILDVVFSELSSEDKRIFLQYLGEGDHDKIWNFLRDKIDSVEDKIKKVADDLKVELHRDLKEAKRRS